MSILEFLLPITEIIGVLGAIILSGILSGIIIAIVKYMQHGKGKVFILIVLIAILFLIILSVLGSV